MSPRLCTYRVQLQPDFGFEAAAQLSGYLAELGVSHLYCSPSLQAAPGSNHGYDVVDPTRISSELGGEAGWRRLCEALRGAGLAALLDIVPNHMAALPDNPWWWDVMEDGPQSPHADDFDVDWESVLDPAFRGRLLVPVLGDHVGRVVDRGELRVERRADGRLVWRYHDQSGPLSLPSVAPLLHAAAQRSGSAVLQAVARAAARLGLVGADGGDLQARRRERAALWAEVRRACDEDDAVARAVDDQLATLAESPLEPARLLEAQNHRPARWRLALRLLNYRRFFDVTQLVALRAEREQTFAATHRVPLRLLHDGELDGLRIDHVDGLRDPAAYLRRLRAAAGGDAWIVVEKILGDDETLPPDWPVQGTTGYEFAAVTTRLLNDPTGHAPLLALHAELGGATDLAEESRAAKLQVMAQTLVPDVDRLVLMLRDICRARPRQRDHTPEELRDALVELIAALPVYRTYATEDADAAADDVRRVQDAVAAVRRRRPDLDAELLDLLCTLVVDGAARTEAGAGDFVLRLQQLSAAVMAKGMEDTTFYRVLPLASLCEVGCAPEPFSATVEEFHRHCQRVQAHSPQSLLATTTHDTKRSEDVRARMALLAEMPERWADLVRAWHGRNARYRRDGMPDAVMEHLVYQSLLGAWPIDQGRMAEYMDKASREAKLHTSWIDPVPAYDSALQDFVAALYADSEFMAEVEEVVRPLVEPGRVNSLAVTLLKLAAPGVPDVYQGCELWALWLVDPDNRRPVDYAARRELLCRLHRVTAAQAWRDEADSGLPKLLLTHRALQLRRRRPELFGVDAAYAPLRAAGPRAEHVVAFARGAAPGVVAVAPRWPLRLAGDWADTRLWLPGGEWHDQLTGAVHGGDTEVALADLLRDFPVALLAREPWDAAAAQAEALQP